MTDSLLADIKNLGFGFVSCLKPDLSTITIAASLGEVLIPWKDGAVQRLAPRSSSTPNTYSGIFGLGGFPFHTDLAHWEFPPRYLLLRCLKGYPEILTNLIDGQRLIGDLGTDQLTRAIVKPRRPIDGKVHLMRLVDHTEKEDRLRWDEVFLVPASRTGKSVFAEVKDWLCRAKPLQLCLQNCGDTVVIDNWRMLHARTHVPSGREDRIVERVYLRALK